VRDTRLGTPDGAPLIKKNISNQARSSRTKSDILLPVEQRLIAKEPLPLSVNGIVHGNIRENRAGRVVCVKACSSR
jgi:hypothetical protein